MNLPLLHSLRQKLVSKYVWVICFVSLGRESFAGSRSETANGRGAGVKPHTKFAALAIVMIASSSVVEAQDGRPTTARPPGTTQGPWTSVKPGNSESRCSPGEYAVGIEVEVAPPGQNPAPGAFHDSALSADVTVSNYLSASPTRPVRRTEITHRPAP